jgi:hypothetical protein
MGTTVEDGVKERMSGATEGVAPPPPLPPPQARDDKTKVKGSAKAHIRQFMGRSHLKVDFQDAMRVRSLSKLVGLGPCISPLFLPA